MFITHKSFKQKTRKNVNKTKHIELLTLI